MALQVNDKRHNLAKDLYRLIETGSHFYTQQIYPSHSLLHFFHSSLNPPFQSYVKQSKSNFPNSPKPLRNPFPYPHKIRDQKIGYKTACKRNKIHFFVL